MNLKKNSAKKQPFVLGYRKIARALVGLLGGSVEVVLHDLLSKKILWIEGSLSLRKAGDPSLLGDSFSLKEIVENPYSKIEYNGKLLKSISLGLDDNFLMCINFDTTPFLGISSFVNNLLAQETRSEENTVLFKNDWQYKVNLAIKNFLDGKGWNLEELKKSQKKEIVFHLKTINAFSEKKAADYIANAVGLSRASVFKYLNQWVSQNERI